MQVDVLPSYQQATSRGDWLRLAAPYVAFTDYPALCCVNRRFWSVFAPRIWRDPCAASGWLGWRGDSDVISWWIDFIDLKLHKLSAHTRALVRVLDARAAAGDFSLYLGLTEKAVIRALELLPNLQSLLLDNNPNMELRFQRSGAINRQLELSMLSVKNCPNGVPRGLIKNYSLRGLVFLDVSGIASVTPQLLEPVYLPELRILKLCRQGISSTAFAGFSAVLGRRLWSLDLSNNKLTDDAFQHSLNAMFLNKDLRSDARAQTEGTLKKLPVITRGHGQFFMLHETAQSILFVPDERYLADTPPYTTPNAPNNVITRSDGSVPVRSDTADGVLRLLSRHDATDAAHHIQSSGLTHLHLSGNHFSAFAIERMLRESHGQLEHFDCDSMRFFPPSAVRGHLLCPSNAIQVDGFSGLSHIFRPVWSSNLQSLRIHHSLVTNIPTLRCSRYSSVESTYLAETQLHARLNLAYPLAFVPDMNPRLESLTLTCVPRHSFGLLVKILISFLQQLGLQESYVTETNKAEASRPGKSLRLVRGLRNLTLEMEPESLNRDDAEHLMTFDETQYSFFDSPMEETPLSPRPALDLWTCPDKSQLNSPLTTVQPWDAYNPMPRTSDRDTMKDQWVLHQPEDGRSDAIVVWAGNPEAPNDVVKLYNYLVINCGLKEDAGPVNLAQQKAGAPCECLIFHTVWLYASLPQRIQPPQAATLQEEIKSKSKNVAAALRRLRVPTREAFEAARKIDPDTTNWYWGGTLRIIDSQ
ncbi:hypothetical protein TRIATDRAFT_158152 [Trichoderma atroviride IMI 206040]|uniref:Leucine rich repeat domain containing protein n=1 Tax=Hypocrea atroviridis (strain ATCC 20476 / IMI 206040) TaxID=452589 RepID=G9NLM5_HYPAI|nr:uncharacterized protein TRIATDRAFT_158152 [Trichoderma atroviride IMI 206040]EHK48787.1 hypothetical protein TRIATDRAFT_158152 [Trichoderma atroviride IMI 206040]